LHHIQPDHLGTPRKVIQTSNNTALWNWPILNNPFGETAPTGSITLNLRFPGQYFDAETGLHYNYFRDYEPATGRYVESDPIGLGGGISTYGYANASPGLFVDPLGLDAQVCCTGVALVGNHCFINISTNGRSTTYGLQGPAPWGNSPVPGCGTIFINHGFDDVENSKCGPMNSEPEVDECVVGAALQYENPTPYRAVRGPNSNTFASTVAGRCNLKKPFTFRPDPGWGQSPAPYAHGTSPFGPVPIR